MNVLKKNFLSCKGALMWNLSTYFVNVEMH